MIISIAILLLAIPAGFLIAWMARDELVSRRKWVKAIIILSFFLGILFFVFKKNEIGFSLAFIMIVSLISYRKSFDRKWAKNQH
jgi:O-antigen ligase